VTVWHECQEIENDEHRGQVVGSVAEIVLEKVPVGSECVERFVLPFQALRPQAAVSTTLTLLSQLRKKN
jgi:hypothetical protein